MIGCPPVIRFSKWLRRQRKVWSSKIGEEIAPKFSWFRGFGNLGRRRMRQIIERRTDRKADTDRDEETEG